MKKILLIEDDHRLSESVSTVLVKEDFLLVPSTKFLPQLNGALWVSRNAMSMSLKETVTMVHILLDKWGFLKK